MRYVKAVLYPLMTAALGFIAISIPFAYALQNALIPLAADGAARAVMSPAWLYYDGTMLIWLISFVIALFANIINVSRRGPQLVLLAPIYAPICYAIALLILVYLNIL